MTKLYSKWQPGLRLIYDQQLFTYLTDELLNESS